jgi:hypothetical protein
MGLEPPSDFKKRDLIFASCQWCIHRHSTDSLIVEIRPARALLGTSLNQASGLSEIGASRWISFPSETFFMAFTA